MFMASHGEGYLSGPEYAFVSTMLWINRWAYRIFDRYGLLGVHVHAMARLAESPGIVQRDLAERIHRDMPATSRIVQEMVKKQLIEQRTDPDDRRCKRLYLTRKGEKTHTEVQTKLKHEREAAGIDLDPDDVEALWRIAQTLQDKYRTYLERTEAATREAS